MEAPGAGWLSTGHRWRAAPGDRRHRVSPLNFALALEARYDSATMAPPTTHHPLRLAVALGLALAALLLRWPYLQLVPRLTDETAEVRWAIRIAQGEILPLTHVDTYNGPLQPYLLAGLLRLFGFSPWLPRVMMAVLGAVLAGVVAWLAWGMAEDRRRTEDGGRRTGERALTTDYRLLTAVLAGALVATSFPLILINSHLAWSNGLTPLFTTLALGATWWAVRSARGGWLVTAGLLWALALQTHPSVVALLPGVLGWTLWQPQGRAWLRTRWAWLAVAAFGLGYSNMLWFNLTQAGASVVEASNPRNAFGLAASPLVYAENLAGLAVQLARMLAGAYAPFEGRSAPFVMTPLVPVYGVLACLALLWAARRQPLLAWAVLSFSLSLPLVSRAFDALYDTRYIAPLLPLVYLAAGLALGDRWPRLNARARLLAAPLVVALVLAPLAAVAGFYAESEARGLTNAPLLAIASRAHTEAANGALVLVDRGLGDLKLGGGGDPARALEHLLTLEGTAHEVARVDKLRYFLEYSEAPLFLVLAEPTQAELSSRYRLTPTDLAGPGYRVFTAPPGQ